MFLKHRETGSLVKIMDAPALFNPTESEIVARSQSGEEEQDPEPMAKKDLIFPSGEPLPLCWLDNNYQNK